MKIAFLGIGNVGFALADPLARRGHDVVIAARDLTSESVRHARNRNPALEALPAEEGVREAEVVFLATPFAANEEVLRSSGDLRGKILAGGYEHFGDSNGALP